MKTLRLLDLMVRHATPVDGAHFPPHGETRVIAVAPTRTSRTLRVMLAVLASLGAGASAMPLDGNRDVLDRLTARLEKLGDRQ
jgi:hypothetical protein